MFAVWDGTRAQEASEARTVLPRVRLHPGVPVPPAERVPENHREVTAWAARRKLNWKFNRNVNQKSNSSPYYFYNHDENQIEIDKCREIILL